MDTERSGLEGRRLTDRYVLEEQLASGGMGTMWLARDEVLGRPVAIKVLHDHLAQDEDLLQRFHLEAVAAARLSHPAVVRVFDTGIDDGVCFIVMELVDGSTAADLLSRKGALPPAEAVAIVRGALQALAHSHKEGVIHRDIKPGNILVGSDGLVKLADFGIAKAAFAGSDLTTTGDLLGTSRYLSPEQVMGGEVDHRSDLYAAGVVLYELLTGRPPFDAETHIATATIRLTKDPAPPRSLRPGISRALEAVVMKALAREPDQRFQSAEEMVAALNHAAPGGGRPPDDRTAEQPAVAGPRRRSLLGSWVAIPIILAAVAALIVGGFLLLEGFDPGGGESPAQPPPAAAPLEIAATHSYDPFGDNTEHDESLGEAIDGDAATYWPTEGYNQDLGIEKDGVGIVLDIGDEAQVGQIRIESSLPGWDFDVYAGDSPDGFSLTDTPIGADETAAPSGTYALEPIETRYVLVWITGLVQEQDGKYRAQVNEVELLSPGA